jgi:hypothetical protein
MFLQIYFKVQAQLQGGSPGHVNPRASPDPCSALDVWYLADDAHKNSIDDTGREGIMIHIIKRFNHKHPSFRFSTKKIRSH